MDQEPVVEAARSVARKPLPPVPKDLKRDKDGNPPVSIVLFYQYMEPAWSEVEHRNALKTVLEIAKKNNVMGRGRYRHARPLAVPAAVLVWKRRLTPTAAWASGLPRDDDRPTHLHSVPGSAPMGR
jgi:hypothetical protein